MSSVFQHKCSFITIKDSSNCSAIRTTSNSLFRYSILLSTKLKSSNKLMLKPKSHRVSSTSNHAESKKNLKCFEKKNRKLSTSLPPLWKFSVNQSFGKLINIHTILLFQTHVNISRFVCIHRISQKCYSGRWLQKKGLILKKKFLVVNT